MGGGNQGRGDENKGGKQGLSKERKKTWGGLKQEAQTYNLARPTWSADPWARVKRGKPIKTKTMGLVPNWGGNNWGEGRTKETKSKTHGNNNVGE